MALFRPVAAAIIIAVLISIQNRQERLEEKLDKLLEENDRLSLNRYCRLAHLSRRAAEHLLAKFVRYDIVEPVFEGHKFHFKLK